MVISRKDPSHKIMLKNKEINNSNEETLCGILLESKLNFECQKNSLCKRAVF